MNIVVTGASRGIGRAIAERFASEGHSIFMISRSEAGLKQAAAQLEQRYPGTIYAAAFNLAEREEVRAAADWVISHTDAVDVLVNNVGSFVQGHVHTEPEGAFEEMMATNVFSAYYLCRYLLPAMIRRRSGHIFNMCSIASLQAYDAGGSYSISKYALAGLSANLRHELKSSGIKVTSIFPGAVYTDAWSGSGLPESRFMKASDIAELVYTSSRLSPAACVEEIVVRPLEGDI